MRKRTIERKNKPPSEAHKLLSDMLRDGLSIERSNYLAYVYGPPENWLENREAALPDVLRTVSASDKVGPIVGSA